MSLTEVKKILITGFAMFAMLFGSGNVIFPLILGRDSGNQLFWGLLGFLLSAVVVPLLGFFSTMLSHGDYKILLAPLGKIASFVIILISMVLLGPFALIPRCIVISHAAIKMHFPSVDLFFFGTFCAALIFLCTIKNNLIIDLLGRFFGPLKIILLLSLIIKGLLTPSTLIASHLTKAESFSNGLLSGYGTCDLLGTIFLAGLIISSLRKGMHPEKRKDSWAIIILGVQASLIGGILLALVYAGFCIVAGFHGQEIANIERGTIFSTIAVIILGQKGGLLANITVAISCLATAISLTAIFAMYLHKDLSRGCLNYTTALVITCIITACVTNLGFSRIMSLLSPMIQVIYPLLILYTLWNIIDKLWKLKKHQPLSITMKPESSDWGE
ncbi:MAG: branched-chain amino acid transport system II carrier protein [Chthoniobacterales bacterium]|nr:branched-chain amino acid transport system II carrier protein [Chthoniobacterales bacterium]